MAISFVAGASSTTTTTTVDATIPGGTANGDYVFALLVWSGSPAALTTYPAGWSTVTTVGTSPGLQVYLHRYDSATYPGPHTFAWTGSQNVSCTTATYTGLPSIVSGDMGQSNTGALNVIVDTLNTNTASSATATHTPPAWATFGYRYVWAIHFHGVNANTTFTSGTLTSRQTTSHTSSSGFIADESHDRLSLSGTGMPTRTSVAAAGTASRGAVVYLPDAIEVSTLKTPTAGSSDFSPVFRIPVESGY